MKFVEGMPELISDLRDRNKRLNGFLFAEFGPKDHPTLVFPKPVPGDIASNKPATKGYSCQSYLVVHNMGFLRIALVEGPAEMYSTPRIKELLTSGKPYPFVKTVKRTTFVFFSYQFLLPKYTDAGVL